MIDLAHGSGSHRASALPPPPHPRSLGSDGSAKAPLGLLPPCCAGQLFPKGNGQGKVLLVVVLAKLLRSLIPVTPALQTVPNTFSRDRMAKSELPIVARALRATM